MWPFKKKEKNDLTAVSILPKSITESSELELRDILAPSALKVNAKELNLGEKVVRSFFVISYPRFLSEDWFSPIINLPELLDVSIFVHPMETTLALKNLRKKTAQVQAQMMESEEKGQVRNPVLETAFQDIENLRNLLQQGSERLFRVGTYITIYADNLENLNKLEAQIVNLLEGRLIYAKPAIFQQLEGFASVLPLGTDKLEINTPLNSTPVSSFFPFASATLTSDEGILYGLNRHNSTLVIFDRFSLENANMVIFAKSGSGKSYACKIEAVRLLMTGTDILIIDPENEYENLANTVGGSFFKISLASPHHVNPFDIPVVPEGEDPSDVLKSHIVNLTGLVKLMLGDVKPEEEGILDRAISETYASHDIVPGRDFSLAEPPLLTD